MELFILELLRAETISICGNNVWKSRNYFLISEDQKNIYKGHHVAVSISSPLALLWLSSYVILGRIVLRTREKDVSLSFVGRHSLVWTSTISSDLAARCHDLQQLASRSSAQLQLQASSIPTAAADQEVERERVGLVASERRYIRVVSILLI